MAFSSSNVNIDISATDRIGAAIASARSNLSGFATSAKAMLSSVGVGLGTGALVAAAAFTGLAYVSSHFA